MLHVASDFIIDVPAAHFWSGYVKS